ncbi:MAG: hypothetical protein M3Q11_03465, partial [Pseudomonadota bacterium]|nr:hypothetical protein [Pseudomonadota bacterium]
MKLKDVPSFTHRLVVPLLAAATLLLATACTAPSQQTAADQPAPIAQAPADEAVGLAPGTAQPEPP